MLDESKCNDSLMISTCSFFLTAQQQRLIVLDEYQDL